MKKALIIIAVTLTALILTVAVVGFSIIALVAWVWGGNRFSPEDAMEAVSLGSSQWEKIETEDCHFYYRTIADCYEVSAESNMADRIYYVTPVTKTKIGMWRATPDPRSLPVYSEGTKTAVARLVSVESDGSYHNFLIPVIDGTEPPSLPDALAKSCFEIIIDGREVELFRQSYFTTDTEVYKFEINGRTLVVGN